MQRLPSGRQLDPGPEHLMPGLALNARDRAVLGLAGVAIGTMVFTDAARRLGWHPLVISLALFGTGRLASL